MELRNKKTKKLGKMTGVIRVYTGKGWRDYYSLAKLNEEWEDYKPKEPLIKDENIRKIIREWAGENDSTRAVYYSPKNALADSYGNSISFNLIFRELNHGAEYTIDELCGRKNER